MPYLQNATDELRGLNKSEKQIIALTVSGGFFACLDFTVFAYFDDAIGEAFFPSAHADWLQSASLLVLIILGYISRPLGGMILADIGDRFGRKRVMLLSLFIVSIATFLIALLPTYHQIGLTALILLMVLRFLQGFGFGAEVPASWVTLAECMPRAHIGSACGMLVSAFILALLVGNFLAGIISSLLTPEQLVSFGWRIPFLIGALGTLVAIALRARMAETPIWLATQARNQLIHRLPIQRVFTEHHYGLLMTLGISWFNSNVFVIVFLILPKLGISVFEVSESLMSIATMIGIFFAMLGALLYGYCADRFNSGRIFTIGCILLAISSGLFFSTLQHNTDLLIISYVVLGFCAGVIGILPSICVRLFPAEVRLSGLAFSYNVAYAITGAFIPFLLTYASDKLSVSALLYLVFLCIIGVIMGFFLTNLHGLYRIEERQTALAK